jgi:hypothetical protein
MADLIVFYITEDCITKLIYERLMPQYKLNFYYLVSIPYQISIIFL